jgi:hypothetical protein
MKKQKYFYTKNIELFYSRITLIILLYKKNNYQK